MASEEHSDNGWVSFAGIMFALLGGVNVIFGLAILVNSEWVVFAPNSAWLLDFSQWGWAMLIVGVIQLFVGWGVMSGQSWARITGIVIAVLSALDAQIVTPIYRDWGLLGFVLAVLVIYALTVHGGKTTTT